jgi:hypothetical protein
LHPILFFCCYKEWIGLYLLVMCHGFLLRIKEAFSKRLSAHNGAIAQYKDRSIKGVLKLAEMI